MLAGHSQQGPATVVSSRTILILGGTAEAYELARRLSGRSGLRVISSLAGRTIAPRRPEGEWRVGGFGGPEGLARYFREQDIFAVIDATHPFAARMGWNAAQACAVAGIRLARLERPAWVRQPGDNWDEAADWDEAIALLGVHSRRVLLAVGRQELEPFAALDHVWFLIRSIEPPDPLLAFAQARFLPARGPFTLESERDLLRAHGIDTIVCKNSGGDDAKLIAAREMGIRVVMKRRPPRPVSPMFASVADAVDWVSG